MGLLNGMHGGINLMKGLISSVMKIWQILMMSLTFLIARGDKQRKNLRDPKQHLQKERRKTLHLKKFQMFLRTLSVMQYLVTKLLIVLLSILL
nr:putative alternative large T antigen [Bat polyomavirus BtSY1]